MGYANSSFEIVIFAVEHIWLMQSLTQMFYVADQRK